MNKLSKRLKKQVYHWYASLKQKILLFCSLYNFFYIAAKPQASLFARETFCIYRDHYFLFYLEKANACPKCEEKRKKIDEAGLPTPYALVKRLGLLSNKLSGYLTAVEGNWKPNIYTSKWMQSYMKEVSKASNKSAEAAKLYIKR